MQSKVSLTYVRKINGLNKMFLKLLQTVDIFWTALVHAHK